MKLFISYEMRIVNLSAVVACVIWAFLIMLSMVLNVYYEKQQMYELAKNSARDHFNKDQAFRFWATSHGGVYVKVDDRTPPNPYLKDIPERDITTPSGKRLTLMNPAYMLRQMMADYYDAMDVKGHITSLKPLNPKNAPYDWEIKALAAFEKGITEFTEIIETDGEKVLRLMKPMVTQQGCLKCHESQGYKVGEVRGGVGVSISMEGFTANSEEAIRGLIISHISIGVVGFIAIGVMTIVARQRRLERKKLDEQQRIKGRAISTSVSGIVFADMDLNLSYVNKAFLSMWGYQFEKQVIGKKATDLFQEDNKLSELWDALFKTGGWLGSMKAVKENGDTFTAKVSASLVKDDNNKPLCIMASFLDTSKEQEMEAQLRQSQKLEAIGDLAGGIAHDFNNILYAIIGFAELVQDNLPEGGIDYKNQQEVITAANRAKELVKQILAFSRKTEREKNPVQVNRVIKEVLKLLRSSLPSTIEITSDIYLGELSVLGDTTEIHQIVMNLCTNAYQTMRNKGGILDISLTLKEISPVSRELVESELKPGQYVELKVSDTGEGIDDGIISKIFDPYFTTKVEGDGTGLGLSVVYGIVKKYEGGIFVKSEPGRGTTFTVYLPAMAPA